MNNADGTIQAGSRGKSKKDTSDGPAALTVTCISMKPIAEPSFSAIQAVIACSARAPYIRSGSFAIDREARNRMVRMKRHRQSCRFDIAGITFNLCQPIGPESKALNG